MERWMHRQVAADVSGQSPPTLEIGAGTLNQLAFENPGAIYDIVEPFSALYVDSPHRGKVRRVFSDIAEVPPEYRYQRITSVAALEHICDLPAVVARSALLLDEGGRFRAAIPSEGGFLWRMGWSATTGMEFRLRWGLDYEVFLQHEHVNTAAEIEAIVRALFKQVDVTSFGVGRQFSLYRFIAASQPDLVLARETVELFGSTLPSQKQPSSASERIES
jgi:hypothetical protein